MRKTPNYITDQGKAWRSYNNMNEDEEYGLQDAAGGYSGRSMMSDYMDEEIVEHMETGDVQQWLQETAMDARQGEDLELALEAKHTLYKIKAKLDRMYDALPSFPEAEKQWSKEELADVLQGK